MADDSLPDVDMNVLRGLVYFMVEDQPEEQRLAMTAALERGDATLHDLGDSVGVKVMGRKLARIPKSNLRRPEDN